MIRREEIWDEIERHCLSEYVSRYEIWLKSGELKEFLSKHKIIKKSGTVGVYIIIFLYFLAFLAGFGYVYQGLTEVRGDRVIVGFIIIFIGAAALYVWITKRFTAMEFLLNDGVLLGISHPKIRKLFGFVMTYIAYKDIEDIYLENINSDLQRIVIETKDGKYFASDPKEKKAVS